MKKLYILFITLFITTLNFGQTVIINEIHYDNDGADTGEGFEIAGTAGIDLTGYSVVLYNGSTNLEYDTIPLSGVFTDETNGYGFLWFTATGLQNGAPDGLALVDPSNNVLQFLSYEGVITAVDGPAIGLTSTDIGVSEPGTTPVGQSLQFNGTSWVGPLANTQGSATIGQTTLSIEKNQIAGFSMYPNPVVHGKILISSNNSAAKQVAIYNLVGQQVYNKSVIVNEPINVSSLTKGMYILKVEEEGKIATRKLLIN